MIQDDFGISDRVVLEPRCSWAVLGDGPRWSIFGPLGSVDAKEIMGVQGQDSLNAQVRYIASLPKWAQVEILLLRVQANCCCGGAACGLVTFCTDHLVIMDYYYQIKFNSSCDMTLARDQLRYFQLDLIW